MRTPPQSEPSTTAAEPADDDNNRDQVDDEIHKTTSRMMSACSNTTSSEESGIDDHHNNKDEPAAAAQLEVVLVDDSSSSPSSASTTSTLHHRPAAVGENSSNSNSPRQRFLVQSTMMGCGTMTTTTTTMGDNVDDVEAGVAADKLNETAMTTTSESDDDDNADGEFDVDDAGRRCPRPEQARKESPLLLSEHKSPSPLADEEVALAPPPPSEEEEAAEAMRRRKHQKSLLVRICSAVVLLAIVLTLSFVLQQRRDDNRPNANVNDSSSPGLSSSGQKPGPDGGDNEANNNNGEEEERPPEVSSSSWWFDDGTFYNIGGPAIGQWYQSDEDIFVSSSSNSSSLDNATIVRVCNATTTNAFCTARQAQLLTFHFVDTNTTSDDEPMFLHLYFLRDVNVVMMMQNNNHNTSNINNSTNNINNSTSNINNPTTSSAYYEPFTVNVDGVEWSNDDDLAMSWSSRSTFVVTVPLGKVVQVRALGQRPPLLAVMVLSSNGQAAAGPVFSDRNGASPTSPPMVQEEEPTTTNANDSNGSTDGSSSAPTLPPQRLLKNSKTAAPTSAAAAAASPSSSPKQATAPTTATYVPGDLILHDETGLNLSRGLTARILARANEMVSYANGEKSTVPFHTLPDAGATFPTTDDPSGDEGGWIYVSNSEVKPHTKGKKGVDIKGGVGAIRFNRQGEILHYQLVLNGTIMNCGGGRTPWGAWISGEEVNKTGRIWQVDPTGRRPAQPLPMGDVHSGLFESFAYDVRDRTQPHFYMTQDDLTGALRRLYVCVRVFIHRHEPGTDQVHNDRNVSLCDSLCFFLLCGTQTTVPPPIPIGTILGAYYWAMAPLIT
jgi:hypothetical protein